MDVLPVSPQPVTTASRQNSGGASSSVQMAPVVASPVSSTTGASSAPVVKSSPSPNQIEQAIGQVNDAFTQKGQNLYASFEKDKITGIEIIQFKDKDSEEVIRQIPSKEILAFAQSLELPQGWRGQWIRNMS
ncbi:MAG: flagellar protein FlaG [Betaproteobacteria bacterium]|nr:flagellar protein FlaG [Betaproteobacteria bacterium]